MISGYRYGITPAAHRIIEGLAIYHTRTEAEAAAEELRLRRHLATVGQRWRRGDLVYLREPDPALLRTGSDQLRELFDDLRLEEAILALATDDIEMFTQVQSGEVANRAARMSQWVSRARCIRDQAAAAKSE